MLVSPLRYPGGKAKLFDFLAAIIDENRLFGCDYCEPYAGGAGLALKLLSSGFVNRVFLNDIDEAIWAFWVAALDYPNELCALIEKTPISIPEWHNQREIWHRKDTSDIVRLGFATFYLNRTNRSGIIEGAGPIGGYSQTGIWRLDARFDKQKQALTIQQLAPFRKQIILSRLDAKIFIAEKLPKAGSLTYLDPPYYVKGSKLYRNSYSHADHIEIMRSVDGHRSAKWLVSYDDVPSIREIYSNFDPINYTLSYSAGTKSAGQEVIYLSDTLLLPTMKGFSRSAA